MGEEGQGRGRERRTEKRRVQASAFPQHFWALPASAQHLTHSTHSPPGDTVFAGAARSATGAGGSLGPALGTLQGELGPARVAAGAGPGRGLAGFPGEPPAGPQLRSEPRPCPLSSYGHGQLPLLLLSRPPGRVADCEGQAVSIPSSWASCCLVSPQHSVSDVELLLRRHRDFEKLLAAQEEKFVQLQWKGEVSKAGRGNPRRWGPSAGGGNSPSLSPRVRVSPGHFPFRKTNPFFPLPAAVCSQPHILVG